MKLQFGNKVPGSIEEVYEYVTGVGPDGPLDHIRFEQKYGTLVSQSGQTIVTKVSAPMTQQLGKLGAIDSAFARAIFRAFSSGRIPRSNNSFMELGTISNWSDISFKSSCRRGDCDAKTNLELFLIISVQTYLKVKFPASPLVRRP